MSKILSTDSPFGRLLALVADVAVVSLALTLSALPIFTLGAGFAAAHFVTGQLVRDVGSRPWATFWHVFAACFRSATLIWVPIACALALSVYELILIDSAQSTWLIANPYVFDMFRVGILLALIVIGCISAWYFALVGYYSQRASTPLRVVPILSHAVVCSIRYWGSTFLTVGIWAAHILVSVFLPSIGVHLVFFDLVFIPGFFIYVSQLMMSERILSCIGEN